MSADKKYSLKLDRRITDVWDMQISDNLQPLELYQEKHSDIYCAPDNHYTPFRRARKKTDR